MFPLFLKGDGGGLGYVSNRLNCHISPNLCQFSLNLPIENLDQLPVRLHQFPYRFDLFCNPSKNIAERDKNHMSYSRSFLRTKVSPEINIL